MKYLGLILLFMLPFYAMSQEFVTRGMSVEEIVPADCDVQTATGDLNKDGRNDVVIIATPKNKEKMKVRDDGYTYNFNQPVLAIYFDTPARGYEFWKKYETILPHPEDEYVTIETSLSVTDRGVLKIAFGYFSTAGSYGSTNTTYLFRYQDNDFFLIGNEAEEFSRNTGESRIISNNYLTHKRLTTTSNEFDKNVKPTSKWSKLPVEPLRRLGFDLE